MFEKLKEMYYYRDMCVAYKMFKKTSKKFKRIFKKKEICIGFELCQYKRNESLLAYCKRLEYDLINERKCKNELESMLIIREKSITPSMEVIDIGVEARLRKTIEGLQAKNIKHFEQEQIYLKNVDTLERAMTSIRNRADSLC